MAGRGPDERWGRLARLDRGEVKARLSGFPEERPERRNATSGAPGSARAGNGTRHLPKVPTIRSAERRSAPSPMGEGRKTGRRAQPGVRKQNPGTAERWLKGC